MKNIILYYISTINYVMFLKLLSDSVYINRPTIVKGDLKGPFSIATTPKCRGGCYSFLWTALLTLELYLIMLSVKQVGIKYHFFFESLV